MVGVGANLWRFLFWFAAEFVLFALVVANGRAYVQANYTATVATDMMISAFNFYFAKKFINDKDNQDGWSMAGCILGGGTGSVFSIFLTKVIYGQ
jgi:hypothetical protein